MVVFFDTSRVIFMQPLVSGKWIRHQICKSREGENTKIGATNKCKLTVRNLLTSYRLRAGDMHGMGITITITSQLASHLFYAESTSVTKSLSIFPTHFEP